MAHEKRYRLSIDMQADELPDLAMRLLEFVVDLDAGKLSREGVSASPSVTTMHTLTEREA